MTGKKYLRVMLELLPATYARMNVWHDSEDRRSDEQFCRNPLGVSASSRYGPNMRPVTGRGLFACRGKGGSYL